MPHARGKFLAFVQKACNIFLKHTAGGGYPLHKQYEERGKGAHTALHIIIMLTIYFSSVFVYNLIVIKFFKTSKYFITHGVSEDDFWAAAKIYWNKHCRLVEQKRIKARKAREERGEQDEGDEQAVHPQHLFTPIQSHTIITFCSRTKTKVKALQMTSCLQVL